MEISISLVRKLSEHFAAAGKFTELKKGKQLEEVSNAHLRVYSGTTEKQL